MKHGGFHTHHIPFATSHLITPYVLAISLGFHSFFEGLALGLQRDSTQTIAMFVGIIIHTAAEAFTMGVSCILQEISYTISRDNSRDIKSDIKPKRWVILLIIYSLISPLGICIGLVMQSAGNAMILLSSIMSSYAAGIFLYVSLLGVIVEEFSGFTHLGKKLMLVLAGLTTIWVITVVEFVIKK